MDLLGDFPFVGRAERRTLWPFCSRLHLIEKPSPGTGAMLLADVLTFPALGRPLATMTEGRDEDKWRKRITAKLMSGATIVCLDNLRQRLDSAAVAAAITTSAWEDRRLGESEIVRCTRQLTMRVPRFEPSSSGGGKPMARHP